MKSMEFSTLRSCVWHIILLVCMSAGFSTGGCDESIGEHVAYGDTDTWIAITGRDSAHRVAVDTNVSSDSTSELETSAGTDSVKSTASETDTDTGTQRETDSSNTLDTTTSSDSESALDTGTDSSSATTWTLMMYMAADSDLEGFMLLDLKELGTLTLPDWLNILVLFDRHPFNDTSDGNWTGTRLYRVNASVDSGLERLADETWLGLSDEGDDDELDMGDGTTLESFIQYATNTFPAEHYGIVLSGHGNGWMKKGANEPFYKPKMICADESGSTQGISVQDQLAPILSRHPIDVLGFDACLMSMVEVAFAVKDSVRYMVSSQANESASGWAYDVWIREWLNGLDYSPESLVQKQVLSYRQYFEVLSTEWQVTMSVVDLTAIDALAAAIDQFVATHAVSVYAKEAMTFDESYNEYIDIWDMANLAGDDNLKAAIEQTVIFNWFSRGEKAPGGLSIMFLEAYPVDYKETVFCQATDWC